MKHIVIIGGGFAGMWAALTAARELAQNGATARITLVSRDEYLTVRPRLYEVFDEGLRTPLPPVLAPLGIELLLGTAQTIDCTTHTIVVANAGANGSDTSTLHYDRLVLAAGSEQAPLPVPGVAEFAFDIDTFAAAARFDQHLKRVLSTPDQPGHATFVIVGGGFTGIELAAEMQNRIRTHAGAAVAAAARVIVIERAAVLGPELGDNPRPVFEAALRDAQVEVRVNASVDKIERNAVVLANGERIVAATTVVTAGVRAQPLARQLGGALDHSGRVKVDAHLRVTGVPTVFAAGDIACAQADDSHLALMSCQHAIPMGKHAGYNVAHDVLGTPLRAYAQPTYVTCLDLGDYGALFTVGWERKIDNAGPEVKAFKRMINTQWIYPPSGDRAALLAAADIDAPWPPAG